LEREFIRTLSKKLAGSRSVSLNPGWTISFSTLLEWHGDTFELPQNAKLLASSQICPQQCIKVGNSAYGIQFHLEAEEWNVKTLVETSSESLAEANVTGEIILSETKQYLPGMIELGWTIFGRWIDLIKQGV
jgi:GMP synthase (glutamine-hydrolysing)